MVVYNLVVCKGMAMTGQMQPGPMLDAAIAETIFGIQGIKIYKGRAWYDSNSFLGPLLVSKYSTDWESTSRVVNRLEELEE